MSIASDGQILFYEGGNTPVNKFFIYVEHAHIHTLFSD